MKNLQIKARMFWGITGLSATVVVALAGTAWAWQAVNEARGELARREQELLQLPEVEAKTLATQTDIAKRQLDIQRIEAFLLTKDQLAGMVGEIVAAGAVRGVRVEVPTVEEKPILDDSGKVKPPRGPAYEVRLKITATGKPKDLVGFLYELEHLQRLTYFESWRLDAGETTARNQAAALGEAPGTGALHALLLADLIVAVRLEGAH